MFILRNSVNRRFLELLLIGCVFLVPITSLIPGPSLANNVIDDEGSFNSPGGKYDAILRVGEGGFLTLRIFSRPDERYSEIINDVTGIIWITEKDLLFTVSPIYGRPGIFLFNCTEMKAKRIFGPKTFGKAYPNGADYFQLEGFSKGKIYFYYSRDVDSTDFYTFRTKDHLYQMNLDGTGFEKVAEK
jgi:hypothetical protein